MEAIAFNILDLEHLSQGKHYSVICVQGTSQNTASLFSLVSTHMYFYNVLFFSFQHQRSFRVTTDSAASQRWRGGCRRQHAGGRVVASTTDHRTFGLRQCPLIADHLVKPSSMANHLVRCRRRLAEGHVPSEASDNRGVKGPEHGEEVASTNVEVQIEGIKCVH
ncbi:unnamed protein product [Callosobruchus maculatus]|uniref:CHHC U11-48K-type domain-containing protein n=1 Tax=Callosobruchus maculatus TaxID=64391 RepID=A0A653DJ84_CALMS|nr:unnamed protein product [Callosobruchus maculatus]